MDLDNPFEIIMYYLLIGEITCLDHQDQFPLLSALMFIIDYILDKTYGKLWIDY